MSDTVQKDSLMLPKKFKKRPVVIEAMQLTGVTAEWHAVYQWVEENTLGSFEPMAVIEGKEPYPESGVSIDPRDGRMIISTLEGLHWADPGDWIIRGVAGEFYPCKPDVFAKTYEAVAKREADPVTGGTSDGHTPAVAAERYARAFRAQLDEIRDVIAGTPIASCEVENADDTVSCGWKSSVQDILAILDGDIGE